MTGDHDPHACLRERQLVGVRRQQLVHHQHRRLTVEVSWREMTQTRSSDCSADCLLFNLTEITISHSSSKSCESVAHLITDCPEGNFASHNHLFFVF